MFLRKDVLRICSKFTGEHPCRKTILLQGNFIEIALRLGCSTVNLLHIFRTTFPKNTIGWQLLRVDSLAVVNQKRLDTNFQYCQNTGGESVIVVAWHD